jgi:sugar O-acyltransferase (sialic acid O-acetyltransferase NeuD family)
MSVVLLGGGGHASDVLTVIEARRPTCGFRGTVWVADDVWARPDRFDDRRDVKLVESIEAGAALAPFVVTVGYPGGRRAVHDRAVAAGGSAASPLVHPQTSIGTNGELDKGVVVMGQTWLSARVRVGAHTHVGYGVTVGHDTEFGQFCSVMPGANIGGDVVMGDGVLVGAGAIVLQGLTIADGATIGAGATVLRDVAADEMVVGTPAKPRPATTEEAMR